MKKSTTKTMILAMMAVVSVLMAAQIAKAGISGTKHDLTTAANGGAYVTGTNLQICVFCHTPHNTQTTAPLWNRAANGSTFTTYGTTAAGTTAGAPGDKSTICLSCHDGNTAVNTILVTPATMTGVTPAGTRQTAGKLTSGSALIGTDLRNDHPVGIAYPATGLYTAVGSLVDVKVYTNKVECASCHDVHDNTDSPFLRVANTGSALCLKCHTK